MKSSEGGEKKISLKRAPSVLKWNCSLISRQKQGSQGHRNVLGGGVRWTVWVKVSKARWKHWLNHAILSLAFRNVGNWTLFFFLLCKKKKKRQHHRVISVFLLPIASSFLPPVSVCIHLAFCRAGIWKAWMLEARHLLYLWPTARAVNFLGMGGCCWSLHLMLLLLMFPVRGWECRIEHYSPN